MKLVRYLTQDGPRPGLLDAGGVIRTPYPLVEDWCAARLTPAFLAALSAIDVERLPVVADTTELLAPVHGVRQILAIGLNYRDHAAESQMAIPDFPILFSKSIGSLSAAHDPVRAPASAAKLDWEIELAVLIGRGGRDIQAADALHHVAGYSVSIDVSERAWQLERGGQFCKGKSLDGFTPLGPWLVTPDEVADPQALGMWLDVNGERRQDGSTGDMIFRVAELIAHISEYQTLAAGDLLLTGTPAGVAFGMERPEYLKNNDEIRCGIAGLGEQVHTVELS